MPKPTGNTESTRRKQPQQPRKKSQPTKANLQRKEINTVSGLPSTGVGSAKLGVWRAKRTASKQATGPSSSMRPSRTLRIDTSSPSARAKETTRRRTK